MSAQTCSIDGCGRSGKMTRGMCGRHYKAWLKHGDPVAQGSPGRRRVEWSADLLAEAYRRIATGGTVRDAAQVLGCSERTLERRGFTQTVEYAAATAAALDARPHNLARYRHDGCRCDRCRAANAEHHAKLRARRSSYKPSEIPHGIGGYVNYKCRCAVCTDAQGEKNRRDNGRRRNAPPESIPHGTHSGYSFWSCRCEACVTASNAFQNARSRAKNDRSRENAGHHGEPWTGAQLEILARSELSHREVAEKLGRTIYAVRHMRRLIRSDPKYVAFAGVEAL